MVTECVHRMRAALVGAALTIHGAAVAGERAPLSAVTAWVMGTGLDLVRLGLCKNAINSSAGDGQKSQLIAVTERRGDGERSFDYGNLLHRDVCGRIVLRHIALASWDNAPVEPAKAAHFEDLQELIDTVLLNHLGDFESVASAIQKGNPPGEIKAIRPVRSEAASRSPCRRCKMISMRASRRCAKTASSTTRSCASRTSTRRAWIASRSRSPTQASSCGPTSRSFAGHRQTLSRTMQTPSASIRRPMRSCMGSCRHEAQVEPRRARRSTDGPAE